MIPASNLCVKNTHGDYFADGVVAYAAPFPSGNNVMISVSLADITKDRIIEYESGMFHVYGEGQTIQRAARYGPPNGWSKHIVQEPALLQYGSKLRVHSYIPLHGMQSEISYPTLGVERALASLCESRSFYRDVIKIYGGRESYGGAA